MLVAPLRPPAGGHRRLAWPVLALLLLAAFPAAAQRADARRVAFLGIDEALQASRLAAFREGMRRHGYVEGDNLALDVVWAGGRAERLPALAEAIASRKPEVIVTATPPAVRAVQKATTAIPIVAMLPDPVALGFVASLSRPGGNLTGLAFHEADMTVRKLELLRGVVPSMKRMAILWDDRGGSRDALRTLESVAAAEGIATRTFAVQAPADIGRAVADARKWGAHGLVQLSSVFIAGQRKPLADALAANRMPAVCEQRVLVEAGCLMYYAADLDAGFRDLAGLAAQVLRGASPAAIPMQQPREFEFVVNMKTAGALGLAIPTAVRIQMTDRVE